jgi:hypothetical protein
MINIFLYPVSGTTITLTDPTVYKNYGLLKVWNGSAWTIETLNVNASGMRRKPCNIFLNGQWKVIRS